MTERSPRPASESDFDGVVRTFAEAFAGDPMLTWPLPPGAGVDDIAAVFDVLIRDAYGPLGVIWVVSDDAVAGAAAWLPPEHVARFAEIEAATRPFIHSLTDDGGARYDTFWDWLGGHLPNEPSWFLDILAVREAARGRGFASALVRHGLDRSHGADMPAFLETSNPANVPMYEHFGFHVHERAEAPDGGPTIWFLRADPS